MAYDLGQVALTFATLTKLVDSRLAAEWESGKIKGTEYADVYNKLMQQILALSFESPLKDAQKISVETQTTDQEFVTSNIRPAEEAKLQCETSLCSAQTADQEYVTQNIRPIETDIKHEELLVARENVGIAKTNNDIRREELEIKREELDIARKKVELAEKDVAYKEAQTNFTIRQTEGFDDTRKQKMLDAQLNAWAMMFSSGLLDQVPSVINQCMVDGLYNMMAGEVGAPTSGSCQTPTRSINSMSDLTPCEKKKLEELRKANESSKNTE